MNKIKKALFPALVAFLTTVLSYFGIDVVYNPTPTPPPEPPVVFYEAPGDKITPEDAIELPVPEAEEKEKDMRWYFYRIHATYEYTFKGETVDQPGLPTQKIEVPVYYSDVRWSKVQGRVTLKWLENNWKPYKKGAKPVKFVILESRLLAN